MLHDHVSVQLGHVEAEEALARVRESAVVGGSDVALADPT